MLSVFHSDPLGLLLLFQFAFPSFKVLLSPKVCTCSCSLRTALSHWSLLDFVCRELEILGRSSPLPTLAPKSVGLKAGSSTASLRSRHCEHSLSPTPPNLQPPSGASLKSHSGLASSPFLCWFPKSFTCFSLEALLNKSVAHKPLP